MPEVLREFRLRVRNQADSSNLLILSSRAGDANCLLTAEPNADGQRVDIFEGTSEIGVTVWKAWDRDDGAGSRTITALLADVDARNQMLTNRCIGEYAIDGGSWIGFHAGYLNSLRLANAGVFEFTVGDTDRREQQAELFRTTTATFDKTSCIIGGPVVATPPVAWTATPMRSFGPQFDYGPARFSVISNPSGLLDSTNRVTLALISGNFPPLYPGQQTSFAISLGFAGLKISIAAEEIDRLARPYWEADAAGEYRTDGTQDAQPWGSFPGLEVKMTAVSGGAITRTFPIAVETTKRSAFSGWPVGAPDAPLGDYKALVANSTNRLIVAWDTVTMGAQPSNGTQYDVLVYPRVISAENPLHIRGHPIDIHTAANTQEGIAYDAASAAATKTAIGADIVVELRITGVTPYREFVAKLKGLFGYATRYNAAGAQEFVVTRATQPASVGDLTINDLISDGPEGPSGIIYNVDEESVITGVDAKLLSFDLWNPKVDDIARPMDGIVATERVIEGRRADVEVFGDRILTYELPGNILLTGDTDVFNQALAIQTWLEEAGDVIIDRAGWGQQTAEDVAVLPSVAGKVCEYLDVILPHQVNAVIAASPVTQRGGTRRMQITGRTEKAGRSVLQLLDAGLLAQAAPTPPDDGGGANDPNDGVPVPVLSLAASTSAPFTVATVTVTNVADLTPLSADVEVQYLNQTATPASTDPGAPFGPILTSLGEDEIDAPGIPAGTRLWVRGRTKVNATGQFSDFSAWASIDLGPATDGGDNGGTIPALALSATINASTGQLDAAATVNGVVTSVKFAVGAAGGVAPTNTAVRAATADTSAPFVATNLATMAMGEVRTIGAYAYDVLLNESVLVTLTVTRGTPDAGSVSWKQPVRVATTAAGTLATSFENGDTIDGVVLATSDRILIKDQAAGAENGIYTVNASGAPTRSTDADAGTELVNAAVFVSEGTANADTMWVCTTNATITVDTTALVFVRFGVPKVRKNSTGSTFTRGRLNVIEGPGILVTVADDATDDEVDITFTEGIVIIIACSDETTPLTTGTAKVTFRMPFVMTLTAVRASVTTAPTGSTLIVDINETGTTVLSTKLSIDASEKTSTTAASAAVISDSALADDAEITIDIDQIGSTIAGTGLKVTMYGTRGS